MAIRRILRKDDNALYKVCRPVVKFDRRLEELLNDMADTMYQAEGVGLAASQVGILRRAVVIDCGDGLLELINPEILEATGEEGDMEGCLSFPGESGYVVRAACVKVRAQDRFGVWYECEGEGLLARALQHELDHLDGRVYVDLVSEPPPEFLKEMERLEQEAEE
ncbi:peptide deformylase [Christensenellaceae bacterium OttesenSCG-928-L17]|nr:peptide deformylase [Christensenellaceae bacterium OttesenSCG-928-L17]